MDLAPRVNCRARQCEGNSDHQVPNDGRCWMNICMWAVARRECPELDENGKCKWYRKGAR